MYFISDATRRKNAPLMSAFPRETRAFTEPVSAVEDRELGQGLTLFDLIRAYYPGASIKAFSGRFGFLDRDNKERDYDPGQTDPFVFKSNKSLSLFRSEAHRLITVLTTEWQKLGLPVVMDDDRKIHIPDVHVAWSCLGPTGDKRIREIVTANAERIQFIIANLDIMKKACIVRTVSAGWWAVSYRGKVTGHKQFFHASLSAHKRAFDYFLRSEQGKQQISTYWDEYGDPLLSNCGYPFYSAEVDEQGNPTAKLKVVELFKGIMTPNPGSWKTVLDRIDYRAGRYGMQGFPLAVAGLRRLQAGRKWIHQFTITPSGMRTAYDEKGINSIRVAWMVPYVYNVLLSPMSTVLKAWRMALPGCNHSGGIKTARAKLQREYATKGALWMAEADYSNYDRFIPVDLIRDIVKHVCSHLPNPQYWEDGTMYLFDNANLVWPDFSSAVEGNGILFKPGALGLMSGVKTTGDLGSIVNSVINLQALALAERWGEDDMYQYLIQYMDGSTPGSKYEHYNVQSDDTLLIATDAKKLFLRGEAFNEVAKIAGLKGSVELGDRFLMRHYVGGADLPVPSRVWQNTLSNESPPLSELVFLAGLASRTDGLFGAKTVDPFVTGSNQAVDGFVAEYTREVMVSLLKFVKEEAAMQSKPAVQLIEHYIAASSSASRSGKFKMKGSDMVWLNGWRREISRLLAQEQLTVAAAAKNSATTTAWLYELYKDRNVPSASLILDELMNLDSSLGSKVSALTAKEQAFFKYASSELGVKPFIFS